MLGWLRSLWRRWRGEVVPDALVLVPGPPTPCALCFQVPTLLWHLRGELFLCGRCMRRLRSVGRPPAGR